MNQTKAYYSGRREGIRHNEELRKKVLLDGDSPRAVYVIGGTTEYRNPHHPTSEEWKEWYRGWDVGLSEKVS